MTIPTGAMERLLKPYEAAKFLRLSLSWLAKRRPTGVFIRLGRSIRYSETALLRWMKSPQE